MGMFNIFKKKTEIPSNVLKSKNENSNVTPVQPNTFVCTQCKTVLPMKYMHKQGVCANCISQSPNDYKPKQMPKKQNKSICLCYHKKDEYEWYQVELQFNEDNEILIVDTYYWPVHRGASNGGQATTKLDSDYFTKNSINDFIAFLKNEYKLAKNFNQDFSDLKNRDDIKALFKNGQDEISAYDKTQKTEAIRVLRKNIINSISKTPATTYELSSLLWSDAAKCFPTNYSFSWDGAWFKLDLINRKLYADVSTYPNQFGAARDDRYNLTAAEFHQKAIAFNMSKEIRYMETAADWQKLFDEDLQVAISRAQEKLNSQQKKQEQAQRILNGIVIPDRFAMITPTMEFDEILLELHQRHGSSSVLLTRKEGKYILVSTGGETSRRELSPIEAAWIEQQVNDCIKNQDKTTWKSMLGGDRMNVKISVKNANLIELFYITPLKKYFELKHILQNLATYGSLSESEKTNTKA